MSETWYKTQRYSRAIIEPVTVERYTEASIWTNGRRVARSGGWDNYFQTWKAAHEYLLDNAQKALTDARRHLQNAQDVEGNVRGMKDPTSTSSGDPK